MHRWNGRLHMHANVVRYDRLAKPMNRPIRIETPAVTTYASVHKGVKPNHTPVVSIPSMVLDDSHIVHRDLSFHVMGEAKQFMSIQKLPSILSKEGFPNVKLMYLGGLWVMVEFTSMITKEKFLQHVGVSSWFNSLSNAQLDFVSKERIVWVDIEGVPLHLWSHATFTKIGSKWGEEDKGSKFYSDDESVGDEARNGNHLEPNTHVRDDETDDDGVSDTYFGHDDKEEHKKQSNQMNQVSEDPFRIYDLLKKQDNEDKGELENTISYPPGFTPNSEDNKKMDDKVSSPSVGFNSRIMEDSMPEGFDEHYWDTGRYRWFPMNILSLNVQGLGSKAKKYWVKELNILHKVNFLALQETKMENFSVMEAKYIWGNSNFTYLSSDSIGNSGGIVCMWESHVFLKDFHTVSDNFIAVYGTWMPTKSKILIIAIYAPQFVTEKRTLWQYITQLIHRWNGEYIVMGDFNEVRSEQERLGSSFNVNGANEFNTFIANSGLIDLHFEGYSFTWSHPSAQKKSKLDRFLLSEDLYGFWNNAFSSIPFMVFMGRFFDKLVTDSWNGMQLEDRNDMVRFKKKLQGLKKVIREWAADRKKNQNTFIKDTNLKLGDIYKKLDCGEVTGELLLLRMNLIQSLQEKKIVDARDNLQKAKVKWAVEGDENTKYFHGIINKKRVNLSIHGIMVDGEWIVEPMRVKEAFKNHFASRFQPPSSGRSRINFTFTNRLSQEQNQDLESHVSMDEIRKAVWDCGENKSPGNFPRGCNSSFIALIPKVPDAKFVSDFHPISLIGSMYKVVTKILANRLSSVISDLVSDVQTAFVSNRKKKHAMFFKVDFAKAYDSVRWDFLNDVLRSFGFGSKWRSWISGCFSSAMDSVLVNRSPTSEFQVQCGLKQEDPLAPYLFILVMESLHLSFSRVIEAGIFKGLLVDNSAMISHLFYADDAIFVGEWSDSNLNCILQVLQCFYLTSGLKINIQKSNLMGVGVNHYHLVEVASKLGCSILNTPFKYLGVTVGSSMSRVGAWQDTLSKIKLRLSKWKSKTLSIGGALLC
ncbi:RNA-directed DNA polymerase, eukaryota [Tanacetum coccineum]